VIRAILALLLLLLVLPAAADEDLSLTIELEERAHPPIPGEMVLLRIRGAYRLPITLESLRQPDFEGVDWMQLGEDIWRQEQVRGRPVKTFERRMALFPQASGRIEVPAFTHELVVLRGGRRATAEPVSNTLAFEVAPRPQDATEPGDWWFPVRGLRVEDSWSNRPDRLPAGGGALRVVRLMALGAEPELIPPMPELTGAGVHIFPHPEKRLVGLSPEGPVTTVYWRWTLRPEGPSAGYLNPVALPYFDTEARERREIAFSAQKVAFLGAGEGGPRPAAGGAGTIRPAARGQGSGGVPLPALGLALGLGAAAGLGAGGVALHARARQVSGGWFRRLLPDPDLRAMRRAVRRGDGDRLWRHARAALRRHRAGAPEAMAALEAAIFSRGAPPADLRATERAVRDRVRAARRVAGG